MTSQLTRKLHAAYTRCPYQPLPTFSSRNTPFILLSEILENSLSHNCVGEDIEKCNPSEDLFYITTKPV